jgi:hypothetical protein
MATVWNVQTQIVGSLFVYQDYDAHDVVNNEDPKDAEDVLTTITTTLRKAEAATTTTTRQPPPTAQPSQQTVFQILEDNHQSTNVTRVRPPLNTLIYNDTTIIGNVSFLLDFGILGFGKCGTTTMMYWLAEHPDIQAFTTEKFELLKGQGGSFVRQLYQDMPSGESFRRGYKAPQDVRFIHVLEYFRIHFVHAKIIIGIRHPVGWFESLYNFRVQNLGRRKIMLEPYQLIGNCGRGTMQTCTNKGDFAQGLMTLGKTNHPHPREPNRIERAILERYKNRHAPLIDIPYVPNPVFLFELDQLGDANTTRSLQFRNDVTQFLGLQRPLSELPHHKPGKKRDDEDQRRRDAMKIHICDEQYSIVREELMILARQSSWWIRKVFLNSPTVFVSSREYLEEILQGWMKDPCNEEEELRDVDPSSEME